MTSEYVPSLNQLHSDNELDITDGEIQCIATEGDDFSRAQMITHNPPEQYSHSFFAHMLAQEDHTKGLAWSKTHNCNMQLTGSWQRVVNTRLIDITYVIGGKEVPLMTYTKK